MAVSMKRCEKCGSFFNAAISPVCPTCNGGAQARPMGQPMMGGQPPMGQPMMGQQPMMGKPQMGQPMMGQQPVGQQAPAGVTPPGQPNKPNPQRVTAPAQPNKPAGATTPIKPAVDNNATVPVTKKALGIDPVVGWLVCSDGAEKGRDYRIHADNNYIGRSERMDICIHGDDTISRENHAILTYDSRDQVFYLTSGEGRSIVRLNGKAMLTTSKLEPYDEIEIGTTTLVFVPLCGQYFEWTTE